MRARKRQVVSTRKATDIKLILVKWRDATHQTLEEDATLGTLLVWTIGFEVYRNKKEVALCMEIHEDGAKRDISTIPREIILSIKTLARVPLTTDQ